jgi:hypothetical protein
MMTRFLTRCALGLGLGLALASPAFPQESAAPDAPSGDIPSFYRVKAETSWDQRSLSFTVDLDMKAAGFRLPSGRLEAQRTIERDLPALMEKVVFGLRVDSYRDVTASLEDRTVDENGLLGLAGAARLVHGAFSKDMRSFRAVYELPLEAAMALYIRHSTAMTLDAPMEYRATKPYTGIVIFAKGKLPIHGEGVEDRLSPCLFPRIYDENMSLLVDKNRVDPEALKAWGEVGYATGLNSGAESRVGTSPLKIVAQGYFGTNRSDILISRDNALKILGLPENRSLIAAGKILVILDSVTEIEQ